MKPLLFPLVAGRTHFFKNQLSKRIALLIFPLIMSLSLQGQTLSITNGLQLWLKADAGVSTNAQGGVTTWSDQSGQNNHATPPDDDSAPKLVANALNAQAVVRFDGTDDYFDVAPAPSLELTGDISSYFVINFDDFATFRAVWAKTVVNIPGSTDYYIVPPGGTPRVFRGSGVVSDIGNVDATSPVRAGSYIVLGFQMGGTTLTHYLNGQAIGSGQITATLVDGGTPLKVGTRDDFVTRMKGDIAELLIFDRDLTATERNGVVTYLQTKYGIVNQPPTINITGPANNAAFTAPATVTLVATAADSDGIVTKVDFFANGALVGTATAAPYRIQLLLESAGTVTLGAVATDNKDARTTASNVVVTVSGAAVAPALTATNGLQLWVKADAGVTKGAGDAVTAWADQSGMNNNAEQPAEDLAPVLVENAVNGKPALHFDGVDDYLDVASSPSLAITGDIASFFVVKFDDFANYNSIWGKTAANLPRPNDFYTVVGSGIPRVYRGSDVGNVNAFTDGAVVPAGVYLLMGFNQGGSIMTHYLNGIVTGRATLSVTPTDSGTPLKIGSRDDLFTKMKGDIAELLIYNTALSPTESGSLAGYLGAKYGIPIVLPTNTLPVVSITVPAGGANISAPTNLTVTATASDPGGSIVKVDFFANGALVGTVTKSPFRLTFLVPTGGPVGLTAVATDNLGGTSASSEVMVTSSSTTPSPLPVTAGLQLWLKADGGVNYTAGALSWSDFSGNFNTAIQTDVTAAPQLVANGLNQLPTLRFDGVNDFLELAHTPSLAIPGDITTLFVVKFDDFAQFRTVWAKTAGNQPRPTDYYLAPGTPGIATLLRGPPNTTVPSTDPFPTNTFVIAGFGVAGTTATHYLGESSNGSGEMDITPTDAGTPLRIGTRGDNFTRMKGEIAEILIYNTALSDSDREKVIDYLTTKYFTAGPSLGFSGIRREGSNIVIEWNGSAFLEEAPEVTGPWTRVTGGASPYQAAPSAQRKFYRLRP